MHPQDSNTGFQTKRSLHRRLIYGLNLALITICLCVGVAYAFQSALRIHNKAPIPRESYNRDYSGEGKVIAIIDSGADITHPDLQLSFPEQVKLTQEKTENLIRQHGLPGTYVNSKIPYAYDYYHHDSKIKSSDEHGMHVAGIASAQGKSLGVAPESQLLLMKVFPDAGINAPLESDDFYVQAINDAVTLGADVINLSLGTGAGADFLLNPSVKKALQNAVDQGIFVSVAAGNNGCFGFNEVLPKASNPDYGVIAMPAILPQVCAVASLEGETQSDSMILVGEKRFPYRRAYTDGLSIVEPLAYGEPISLIDLGFGSEEDYTHHDSVDGSVVIVQRGKYTLRELQKRAAQHGARGIIIYNNENNAEGLFDLDGSEFSIPAFIMRAKDGKALIAALGSQDEAIFIEDKLPYPNDKAGTISEFSAWGLTNESYFKPDISAPGGSIMSLGNDGRYIYMSGTSMAAPYVAGAAALGLQRIEEDFPSLNPQEKLHMLEQLIYSTARVFSDAKSFVSPRKQGAGVLDIDGVVAGKLIAGTSAQEAKVNLGDVSDHLSIPVYLRNISNETLEVSGSYTLLSDEVNNGRYTLASHIEKEGELPNITLSPGQEYSETVEIDIADIDRLAQQPNGYFLDGYIQYSYGEKNPTASVAFTSFKGSYEKLDSIETPIYELADKNEGATYESLNSYENYFTHLGSELIGADETSRHIVLGEAPDSVIGKRLFDKMRLAFSPNHDGRADAAEFIFTALRTYQKIRIDIKNEQGQLVESFAQLKNPFFTKNYFGADYNNEKALRIWSWEPEADIADGLYHASVHVKRFIDSDYEQTLNYDLRIDRTAPSALSYRIEGSILHLRLSDLGSGVKQCIVRDTENNKLKQISASEMTDGIWDFSFELSGADIQQLSLQVYDWAYNDTQQHLSRLPQETA